MDNNTLNFRGSAVFLYVIISFFCGVFLGVGIQYETLCQYKDNITKHGLNEPEFTDAKRESSRVFGEDNNLQALAFKSTGASFSCNAEGALENLAKLHTRRIHLEERRQQGEANRARTANIERKTGEAISVERAMRSCMESVIPEVLHAWDDQLQRNKNLGQRWWTNTIESELKEFGIDLQSLERAAEDLEGK